MELETNHSFDETSDITENVFLPLLMNPVIVLVEGLGRNTTIPQASH